MIRETVERPAGRSMLIRYVAETATMGYEHFSMGVRLPLTAAQLLAAIRRLVGDQRRVDLNGSVPESSADILATVVSGEDSWDPQTLFECWSDAGLAELGPYPDLRFAGEIWRAYGADSYCDFYPFADDGEGPRAKGRFLAFRRGQWWVAKVVYPPGSGDGSVQLIRPIEVPGGVAAT